MARTKVYIGFYTDPDIRKWLERKARKDRGTLTAHMNRLLAGMMEEDLEREKREAAVEVG